MATLFYPFTRTTFAILYFKFHNIAVIALCCLLFTFDLHCSVFKVLLPVSFKTRSKYLMLRYFDLILN